MKMHFNRYLCATALCAGLSVSAAAAPSAEDASPATNGTGVPLSSLKSAWEKVRAGTPVSQKGAPAKPGSCLVVIDPGHYADYGAGTYDTGATSSVNKLKETTVIDSVAGTLAGQVFKDTGCAVTFTRLPGQPYPYNPGLRDRKANREESLRGRARFAYALQETMAIEQMIFISLHANTHGNLRGGEVFVDSTTTKKEGPPTRAQSVNLAKKIAASYRTPAAPTTVHTDNFHVLDECDSLSLQTRKSLNGCVLLEMGYLDHPQEARYLAQIAKNPEPAARKIAQGIAAYRNETAAPPPAKLAFR